MPDDQWGVAPACMSLHCDADCQDQPLCKEGDGGSYVAHISRGGRVKPSTLMLHVPCADTYSLIVQCNAPIAQHIEVFCIVRHAPHPVSVIEPYLGQYRAHNWDDTGVPAAR
jgi:hypothetical protein